MVNCVLNLSCLPTYPTDVLGFWDHWFGAPASLIFMALIIGSITIAIYIRNRSLPMLTVLGIYEIAAFSSIITSNYVSSQYHLAVYVMIIGAASGLVLLYMKLVKE